MNITPYEAKILINALQPSPQHVQGEAKKELDAVVARLVKSAQKA